jgi:preprotein translocase subunit YajC
MDIVTIIMLVGMLVVMYFFMIRPQKKQEKELAEMRDNLTVGDEIITTGGIVGSVIIIKDDKLMLETGNGSKITVLRSSVRTVLKDDEETAAK